MPIDAKNEKPQITIAEFVATSPAELVLTVLLPGKNGLAAKKISSERIQKLGLALAGFSDYTRIGRVQIIGQSEISFLNQLDREKIEALNHLDFAKISCILVTKNLSAPAELVEVAERGKYAVAENAARQLKNNRFDDELFTGKLAPRVTLHGVLLGMYGVGVLMTGASGVGKSECALDLITRGHSLVADDAVRIVKIGNRLEGRSPDLTYEHIEIRGLGILNVRDLFGISSVRKCKRIELCIELKKWSEVEEIERLGLEMGEENIFGVKLPKVVLPVSSGRNLSTLIETAVRVHLLRSQGYDAAQKLIEKHAAKLAGGE